MIFDALRRKSGSTRILTGKMLESLFSGASSTGTGMSVTTTTALAHAAVFSCVRVLAESAGQLPLQLYRSKGRERLKATDHPLYSLLHGRPNSYMTAQEFVECVVAHLALRGNFYAFINRNGDPKGPVRELLPFNPGAVTPFLAPDTFDPLYRVRFTNGREEILPPEKVLHVRLFSLDGLVGLSPVTQGRESLGLSMATERHGAKLFSNGARPGGVLQTPTTLSPEAAARLREDWALKHEGIENSNRVAILEEGLTWAQTGLSSEDSQFLETRKYQRSEIAGLFRVPPHMIGDLDKATFSNIEHQALEFVTNGLLPYLTRIEQRIAMQLLTPVERETLYAKFSVNALLRGDMNTRSTFYQRLEQCGAMSPNEIREYEDLNPRVGGDVWLTPLNMASVADPALGDPAAGPADPIAAQQMQPGVAPDGAVVADVQATALNGAQVEALRALVQSVAGGQLPGSTARAVISAAFPGVSAATIDEMLSGLDNFTPAAPTAPSPRGTP